MHRSRPTRREFADHPIATPLLIAQGLADAVVPPTATDAFVTDRCATGQRLEYWTFARLDHGTIVQPGTSLDERLAVWTAARTRRRQAAARASPSDVAGHPLSQTAQLSPLTTLEVKSGFAWQYISTSIKWTVSVKLSTPSHR